jgi:hypothetical protein
MIQRVTPFLVAAILSPLLVTGTAAGADDGVILQLGAAPPAGSVSVTRDARLAPRFTDSPRDVFMLPMFKVDRSGPTAETTLIAIRNVTDQSHDVEVSYFVDRIFDPPMMPDLVETFTLAAKQIQTINLRDLPEITGGQGGDAIIRGWLKVEHGDAAIGDVLSADWFRADDAQNFATDDRMVDVDSSYTCALWDLRYLVGGSFDGGTRLEVFIDTPLGFGTPSFSVSFFNEAGGGPQRSGKSGCNRVLLRYSTPSEPPVPCFMPMVRCTILTWR